MRQTIPNSGDGDYLNLTDLELGGCVRPQG